METVKNYEEKFLVKAAFYIFGIGGLGSYYGMLNQLNFFSKMFPDSNPVFFFPLMNFIMNAPVQFYLLFKGNIFTYKIQLIFNLIYSIFMAIALPLISYFLQNNVGYILCIVIITIQGISTAFLTSGFYGITSFLPSNYMVRYSTGEGLSSVFFAVIGIIIYVSFGENKDNRTLFIEACIYFGIVSLLLIICIYLLIRLYNDEFFLNLFRNSGEISETNQSINLIAEEETPITIIKPTFNDFKELITTIPDLTISILFNYICTYLVVPGITYLGKITSDTGLNNLIINNIQSVSDTIGRQIVYFFILSRFKTLFITAIRPIFMVFIILIAFFRNTNSVM